LSQITDSWFANCNQTSGSQPNTYFILAYRQFPCTVKQARRQSSYPCRACWPHIRYHIPIGAQLRSLGKFPQHHGAGSAQATTKAIHILVLRGNAPPRQPQAQAVASLRLRFKIGVTFAQRKSCWRSQQLLSICLIPGDQLGANRKSSVLVNSVRQNKPPTRKAFPEKITTCIWLTLNYEPWYCTSLLKFFCMLVPNVTVSWTIKDEMLFILYIL